MALESGGRGAGRSGTGPRGEQGGGLKVGLVGRSSSPARCPIGSNVSLAFGDDQLSLGSETGWGLLVFPDSRGGARLGRIWVGAVAATGVPLHPTTEGALHCTAH